MCVCVCVLGIEPAIPGEGSVAWFWLADMGTLFSERGVGEAVVLMLWFLTGREVRLVTGHD